MDSPTISLEEFKRMAAAGIQAELEAERSARYERVSPTTLLTIALIPEWTLPLARNAFGSEMEAALVRLQEANQIELIESPLLEEQDSEAAIYRLLVTKREDILQEHLNDFERNAGLQGLVTEAGQRIFDTHDSIDGVSPITKRWAILARHLNSGSGQRYGMSEDGLIGAFEDEINRALESKNTSEVLNWIDAARPLSDLLKRNSDLSLELALHRASRRIELFRREENDQRHLRTYLARDEQDMAFRALMEGPDELWALHYIGVGGVGKTMLIRHIQTDLAKAYGAATARIDFDFLNPDYPRLSPGLLLWAFAQELMLHDTTGRATELFHKADRLLRQLHDELRLDRQRFGDQRPTDHLLFREALDLYIEAFQQISPRIVLILDTCEELAKVNVGNATPENVEETFRILRALHDGPGVLEEDHPLKLGSFSNVRGIPGLRLIFSGRRPLAQSGYHWSCNNSQLKERPYLRLHEIRGFTPKEAHDYLTHENQIPPVPEHLLDAIIEKSKPTSRVPSLRFDEAQSNEPEPSLEDRERCNPYELKLYAEWAKEDPPPTAETILSSSQAKYVELRIIQRLHDKRVEKLLPAAALLGHFDRATLRVCTEMSEHDFDEAFERLQQEEWVAQRLVTDGKQTQIVCDVEPRMRARLAAYYEERGSDLSRIRERAAAHLEEVTLRGDLQTLDWATFDAALRALEDDPPRAAHWWQQVEARLFAERDAKWVLEVTRALQGDDGAARKKLEDEKNTAEESWMRPLVLATHASALLHSGLGTDVSGIWAEVRQKCARIPMPEIAQRLKLRAFAGGIAANKFSQTSLITEVIHDFWQQVEAYEPKLDAQLAASLVAAVETIVEKAEQLAASDLASAQDLLLGGFAQGKTEPDCDAVSLALKIDDLLEQWSQELPRASLHSLAAFAHSLAGRALCLLGRHNLAASHFFLALNEIPKLQAASSEIIWNDWLPPADVAARVLLEFARTAYPAFLSATKTLEPIRAWDSSPSRSIDSERLYSIILRLRLANGLIHPDTFPPGWSLETFKQDKLFREKIKESLPETCNAHRLVPPLFATMCDVLAANGEVDLPLQRLGQISSEASLYLTDTCRHAERAHSRIVRRLRLRDTGQGLFGSLVDSPRLSDAELIWTLEGMDGEKNQKPIPAPPKWIVEERNIQAALHAIWRTRYAGNEQKANETLEWAQQHLPQYYESELNADSDFYLLSLNLDLLEANLLAEVHDKPFIAYLLPEIRRKPFILADLKARQFDLVQWAERHPAQPEEAARLWFRCKALEVKGNFSETFPALLNKLGAQKLAEIALQEKELLALRLPTKADFYPEKTGFTLIEDFVGATIAGVLHSVFSGKSIRETRAEYDNIRNTPIHKASMATPLPAWEELEQIAVSPQPGFLSQYTPAGGRPVFSSRSLPEQTRHLSQLTPVGWRPLLARIIFCLAREYWKELPETDETRLRHERTIRTEIENAFGQRRDAQIQLPPDWEQLLNQPQNALAKEAAVRLPWWIKVLGGLILLMVLAVVLYGGLFLFGLVRGGVDGWGSRSMLLDVLSFLLSLIFLVFMTLCLVRLWRELKMPQDVWTKFLISGIYGILSLLNILLALLTPIIGGASYESIFNFGRALAVIMIGYIAVGVLSGYFFAPGLIKTMRCWRASIYRLTLELKRSDAPEKLRLQLSRPTSELRSLMTMTRGIVHYNLPEVTIAVPVLTAYAQAAQSFPSPLATELRQRAEEAGKRSRELLLKVEESLHGPCWEAIIAYNLRSETTRPQDINLHFRRTVKTQRTPSEARLKDAVQILLSTNNWLMLTQGWSQCQSEAGMTVSVLNSIDKAPESVGQILHLIGEADTTSAGIRFMTSSNESIEKDLSWNVQESSYFDSAYGSMRSPEDLRRDYPTTSLCILQGKPLLNAQTRLESDRRDAQKLRQFAGELFAQGLPAVLVIPSLPLEVGSEVINKLSATIAKRPGDAGRAMLKTIAEIREAIVALQSAHPDAAWEAAFDVCLYCTDDWYGIARWVQKAFAAGDHKSIVG